MRNLLSANFFRLRKSALFWGTLAFSAAFGGLVAYNYYEMSQTEAITLDGAFFIYPLTTCVLTAVFIPLFFGREYSDSAIRNKLVAGRSRFLVYGANLLTAAAVSLLFCAAHMAAVTAVGVPLIGFIAMDARLAVPLVLGSLVTMAAFCALFTLIVMNCSRKSLSAVVCILGVFLLLFAAVWLRSRLLSPEYVNGVWTAAGIYIPGEPAPNPQYLSGGRAFFELLYALLPSSQAIEYASRETGNLRWFPLYSLAVAALSTGAGVLLFRRKDLK